LEAEKELESAQKGNSITAGISAGIGYNQAAPVFRDAYANLSRQDLLSFSLSIPLFDWGISKGRLSMAKNNLSITKVSIQQREQRLNQEIISTIDNFHLQQEFILSAERALQLSEAAYTTTKQRFVVGKSDVNSILLALNRYKEAQRNYINTLKNYWANYFKIRKLSLFDFEKQKELSSQLDDNINTFYLYK
jgi:outer membrane protein TolC